MKRIKIMGLCLVAVFALSAMTAAGAGAAPAYFACVKTTGGKFSEKKCATPGSGKTAKYELVQGNGKGKVFKGKSLKGHTAILTTPKLSSVVQCTSFTDEGSIEASGLGQDKLLSVFKKCTSAKKNCTSGAPAKTGEIHTFALKGSLGVIKASPLSVGVKLSAESGGLLAEFNCEGLKVKTEGSVIGIVTGGINTFSKASQDAFTVNSKFEQVPNKFEGESEISALVTSINGEGPFESGQEAAAENKGEELEIKAP
jgi:hypothetical protein